MTAGWPVSPRLAPGDGSNHGCAPDVDCSPLAVWWSLSRSCPCVTSHRHLHR